MSKAGERSRSPKTQNATQNGEEANTDLETRMLALWKQTLAPLADEQNKTFQTAIQGMVVGIVSTEVKELETKMQSGFVEVNEKFSNVNTVLERIEKAIALNPTPPLPPPGGMLGTGIAGSSGDALAAPTYAGVVSSSPYQQSAVADVTTPTFTRKTNPTKLFANLHGKEKVSKTSFKKSIVVLALEANLLEADIGISGDALDDRFEIQFAGEPSTAASKCLQFYQSLPLGRGKYKPQLATNDKGQDIQYYIAPDKNPCQMRREILSKRLKDILETQPSSVENSTQYLVKKVYGSIYADNRVVVSVVITGPESARLDWCHPKRIALQLDQAAVEAAFNAHVITSGPGS